MSVPADGAHCGLDVLETFDDGIPADWTIVSVSWESRADQAYKGPGGEEPTEMAPEATWHIVSSDENDLIEGMTGDYFFVGGYAGMNEELLTGVYDFDGCESVLISFNYYFDDFVIHEDDRGELWITVDDAASWTRVNTYAVDGKEYGPEAVTENLTGYLVGAEAFQLKFVFLDDSNGNWGFAIDNVGIRGMP